MFWNDDNADNNQFVVPDDIVDIVYKLECKALPLDHAWALSQGLAQALPWFQGEPAAGVHLIHVAESGNGWYRPVDPEKGVLYLSKRTRLTLRIPKHRLEDAQRLTGSTLDIDGNPLTVGQSSVKPLSPLTTLFSRYVLCDNPWDELQFLTQAAEQLQAMEITAKKLMAGKHTTFRMPSGPVSARSLMVADLTAQTSVRLQQQGLGAGRHFGCGLFLPQKGIKAVNAETD
ncbi:MAG: type I-MYXAN CRISPR-associated protein Cas6/Cmx6 [Gammaproteobacteria bacterium]|nr:type I-MYXAN CRISPR-associated protein Cas6/Cmx6 [Gammaproteobacteria bacterium]